MFGSATLSQGSARLPIAADWPGILPLSFQDSRAFSIVLGEEGKIIFTPGHSDDSVSLILDEGIACTGDLPGPGWGEDLKRQVEASWQKLRAIGIETIILDTGR